jgi:hypothetical protein
MSVDYKVLEDGRISITYDPPEENPNYGEVGASIPVEKDPTPEDIDRVVSQLHLDAKKALPPGTVYDLRTTFDGSGIAWYHVDAMRDWPVLLLHHYIRWPGEKHELGGYYTLGTYRTYKRHLTPLDRFRCKYRFDSSDCWIWTAMKDPNGWGMSILDGVQRGAHRNSWILHNGPIPEGMLVFHTCEKRLCVNPKHLYLKRHWRHDRQQ